MKSLLTQIIQNPLLHAKWLNTLSYFENCGARKIAACEHPTKVKEEMLKHAAEEFRHAHFLKTQIPKVSAISLQNYSIPTLLGGMAALHLFPRLDIEISRFLQERGEKNRLRECAYLLVTYAIEVRAKELYALYDLLLKEHGIKVFIKSILLEEEEHLAEISEEMELIPEMKIYAPLVCAIESKIYDRWVNFIKNESEFT